MELEKDQKQYITLGIFRILGIFFIFISLFFYRSYQNRPVLGLWSYPFFFLIIFVLFLLLSNVFLIVKNLTKKNIRQNFKRVNTYFFNTGILILGISYFIASIHKPQNAARLTDLNLFGSTFVLSIILDWIALALLSIGIIKFIFIRLKSKWRNLFLVLCSIYACILIGEALIRIKSILFPIPQGFPTYTSSIWLHQHGERNLEGFRDTEHSVEKRSGTKRLLVVGDSFAFGWGISQIKDRFGEQLANRLTKMTSFEWESLNASEGDTHTLQHIDFLRRNLKYDPDIVILLYVFNDIDYLKPITNRVADKKLNSRFNLIGILYRNSYLYQELFVYLRLIKFQLKTTLGSENPYTNQNLLNRHLTDIVKFVKLAHISNARVFVVPFDYNTQNVDIYNKFVTTANELDIPVLPIQDKFEGFSISELRLNKFDAHPNELAHSIAAKAVSNRIAEILRN